MSCHNSFQPSEQLAGEEHRRKLHRFGALREQVASNGGFVVLVDLVHGRVHSQTLQQPFDHVAHAAPPFPNDYHCALRNHCGNVGWIGEVEFFDSSGVCHVTCSGQDGGSVGNGLVHGGERKTCVGEERISGG
ncbi:hypothetical protein JHK82_041688 [Glycine max]|nr:hypothetical protein JHK86_041745 [Glycine max]KAG5104718.1 hypothetical protein JHK82_041688 [Glycine max]KAG5115845.1 hypothetical protein JHK84_041958 [Glycine max]